jgi:hypothetical protein
VLARSGFSLARRLQEDAATRVEVGDQSDSGRVPSGAEPLVSAAVVEWNNYDEAFAAITAAL